MDKFTGDIQTLAVEELKLSEAISRGSKPRRVRTDREKALASLIAKAWIATGRNLPTSDEQLSLVVAAYAEALVEIPNDELAAAFKAGIALHRESTSAPFNPEFVMEGWGEYRRAKRHDEERERRKNELLNPGVFKCEFCEDSGFQKVLIWCPTLQNWFGRMRGCKCEAAPVAARHETIPCPPTWKKGKQDYWEPVGHNGLKCHCAHCTNGYHQVKHQGVM
jgi:hypothetical protein